MIMTWFSFEEVIQIQYRYIYVRSQKLSAWNYMKIRFFVTLKETIVQYYVQYIIKFAALPIHIPKSTQIYIFSFKNPANQIKQTKQN